MRIPSASLAEMFEVVPQSEIDSRNEAIAALVGLLLARGRACSYVKNVPAWRNLSGTGKLERMTLQNEGKVSDVLSPSKDVVVARDGDRLSFFRV